MLWIIRLWLSICKTSKPLKIQDFSVVVFLLLLLLTQQFFIFLSQYLTNHNSKAYQPYYFLKELKKIFHEHLNKLLKLWLKFCCDQQKIQKMSHFWQFNGHNSGSKHDNQTNDPIFLIYLSILSIGIFHFCI